MEVLNEYIASVPVTNLWHLWAIVVASLIAVIVALLKDNPACFGVFVFVTFISGMFTFGLSVWQDQHLERQGYIIDPPAFVEMLNDWELVDQQGTLFTVREREPMTKDEIKEWKKHE